MKTVKNEYTLEKTTFVTVYHIYKNGKPDLNEVFVNEAPALFRIESLKDREGGSLDV